MHCPDCRQPLARTRHPGDVQWACVACRRRLVADATLEVLLTDEAAAAFIAARQGAEKQGPRPCPSCRHRMAALALELPCARLVVDHCGRCRTTWFDRGEFERLPKEAAASDGAFAGDGVAVVRASPARDEHVLARADGRLAPDDEEFRRPLCWFTPLALTGMAVSFLGMIWATNPRRRWRRPGEPLAFHPISDWSWSTDSSWIAQLLDVPALLVHSGLLMTFVVAGAFALGGFALERRVGGWRTLLLALLANGVGRLLHLATFGPGEPIPSGGGAAVTAIVASLAVIAPWSSLGNVSQEIGEWGRGVLGPLLAMSPRTIRSTLPAPLPQRPPPPLVPADPPRGLARVPLRALLPAWLLADFTLGRLAIPLRDDILFQPTSAMQHVAGALLGLLFGGWWRAFTLRHPAAARRSADR